MIALLWQDDVGAADLVLDGQDLARDEGLETAILLSLFTDRRAETGDALPVPDGDRRGWYGDALPVVPGDLQGSRLWLLARSVQGPGLIEQAETYVREALAWMLEDLVAERVDVEVTLPRRGELQILVRLYRPGRDVVDFRYSYAWDAQALRRI